MKTGRKSTEKEVKKTSFCYTLQLWEFKINIEKLNITLVFFTIVPALYLHWNSSKAFVSNN